MDDPHIFEGWQTGFGDIIFGGKVNVSAPWRQQPARLPSVRGLKLPTADDDEGLGTGKFDFFADAIVSAEAARSIELSGYGGSTSAADPDDYDLSNGFRWGFGARLPEPRQVPRHHRAHRRDVLRRHHHDAPAGDRRHTDELGRRVARGLGHRLHLSGVQWLLHRLRRLLRAEHGQPRGRGRRDIHDREDLRSLGQPGADRLASGRSRLRRAAAAAATAATAASGPAPANRPPTVKARCEPCVVEIGKTSTVTADAQDPDGDSLSYKWSAPAGTFGNAADRQTIFTCPQKPGSIPVTVSVSDGKGGTASDTMTIQCVEPPRREWKFEDVHFDFDRYSLRPEALRILDEAVKAMQADTTLRLTIEGHTDSIGTNEYNLALGERRANSVREYLASRGIGADRIEHRQLRRRAPAPRQLARRNAAVESPRGADGAAAVSRRYADRRRCTARRQLRETRGGKVRAG